MPFLPKKLTAFLDSWVFPGLTVAAAFVLFYGILIAALFGNVGFTRLYHWCYYGGIIIFWTTAAVWGLAILRAVFMLDGRKILGQLVLVLVFAVIFGGLLGAYALFSLFWPGEDHFADHLVIPKGLKYREPLPRLRTWAFQLDGSSDPGQKRLVCALGSPGQLCVATIFPALEKIWADEPGEWLRHLASSPAWRLSRNSHGLFAERRLQLHGTWSYCLNGYYSDLFNNAMGMRYQFRGALNFNGTPTMGRGHQRLESPADEIRLRDPAGNLYPSSVIAEAGGVLVQAYEQTTYKERLLTPEFFKIVESEAADILERKPENFAEKRAPELNLRATPSPGIYESLVWCNPGEPGYIYLKAFEVTQDYRISGVRMADSTLEYVGFSADPQEQFFANSIFTVYEGDWGKYYAARFEVWFVPASGGEERKIMEDTFRIEGWQR